MQREVFRRTWGVRLIPAGLAVAAAGLLLADAGAGRLRVSWWTGGVAAVGMGALLAALVAWGDRVTVDGVGLHLHNDLLARLGRGPRTLRWEQMRAVHPFHGPHRPGADPAPARAPRALFVIPEHGRRWVLDSLQGMDRLRALLEERLAAADHPGDRPPL